MKKTNNVNFAGMNFIVNEDAYDLLERYIDAISAHFSSSPDKKDILDDIERAIAEHLTELLSPSKHIISIEDVEALITRMGTVQDFEAADSQTDMVARSGEKQKAEKRLYRDMNHASLGGVCAGLAAYFRSDVTIIRVFFVVAALFWGWGILMYLILWILVPEAKTMAEKAAMHGDPLTITKIEEKVRSAVTPSAAPYLIVPLRMVSHMAERFIDIVKKIIIVCRKGFGLFIMIATIAGIFAAAVAATVLAIHRDIPGYEIGVWQHVGLSTFFLGLLSLFLLLSIPLFFILQAGVSIFRKKNAFGIPLSLALLAVWGAALGLGLVLVSTRTTSIEHAVSAYTVAIAEQSSQRDVEVASEFSAVHMVPQDAGLAGQPMVERRLVITKGESHSVALLGDSRFLQYYDIMPAYHDGTLVFNETAVSRCIFFCRQHRITVSITMPELRELKVGGNVEAEVRGFSEEAVQLYLSGAANVRYAGDSESMRITQTDESQLIMSGKGKTVALTISGEAQFMGEQTAVDTVYLDASQESVAGVAALRTLEGRATDNARVFYWGSPTVNFDIFTNAAMERLE